MLLNISTIKNKSSMHCKFVHSFGCPLRLDPAETACVQRAGQRTETIVTRQVLLWFLKVKETMEI